jgi:plastocyanin
MDTLDSRSLRYIDCFAQQFSTPGEITYHIITRAGGLVPLEPIPFKIRIREASAQRERKQHFVTVRRDGLRFVAEPPELEITAGDSVLWNAPDLTTLGYAVRGEGAGGSFDSAALASKAVYTHVFGAPGDFRWTDANHGRVSGFITVRQVDSSDEREMATWVDQIREGVLIVISEDRVEPKEVNILVGQTVFFAVEKAPGITITDTRLL